MAHSTTAPFTTTQEIRTQLRNAKRYWGLHTDDNDTDFSEVIAFTIRKNKIGWDVALPPVGKTNVVRLKTANIDLPALLYCSIKCLTVTNILPGISNIYYLQQGKYLNLVNNSGDLHPWNHVSGLAIIPCQDEQQNVYFYFCLYAPDSDADAGDIIVRNRLGQVIRLVGPGGGGPPGDTAGLRIPSN